MGAIENMGVEEIEAREDRGTTGIIRNNIMPIIPRFTSYAPLVVPSPIGTIMHIYCHKAAYTAIQFFHL